MMKIDILTLFPEMLDGYFSQSIMGRARETGQMDLNLVQWRDYAVGRHNQVDDAPYGGGAGMVMMCEPLFKAVEDLRPPDAAMPKTQVIYLSPQGDLFNQEMACEIAEQAEHLILVCGRYEGVDQRASDALFDREISVGDYVLTGGELGAAILTDAVVRLLPGVLGNENSAEHDSHMDGVFDHPHYTRPEVFRDMAAPRILLDGHQAKVDAWRRRTALANTMRVRPDLMEKAYLSAADWDIVEEIKKDNSNK